MAYRPQSSWQSSSHARFSAWETLRATRIVALDRDGTVGGNTAKPLGAPLALNSHNFINNPDRATRPLGTNLAPSRKQPTTEIKEWKCDL